MIDQTHIQSQGLAPAQSRPGLFITATDTEVGKTAITSTIAHLLHQQAKQLAIFKPFASGCQKLNGKLINEDALNLKIFSHTTLSMNQINPVRYEPPLAPAAAAACAAAESELSDFSLSSINEHIQKSAVDKEMTLIEGVGGLCVPIARQNKPPKDPEAPDASMTLDQTYLVTDLIAACNLPVVIVARAGLGTINHTTLTIQTLKNMGVKIVGFILNQTQPDEGASDISTQSNQFWIEKLTQVPCLAHVPYAPWPKRPDILPGQTVDQYCKTLQNGNIYKIPEEMILAISQQNWLDLASK